jgi:signal transduction histidine kinase
MSSDSAKTIFLNALEIASPGTRRAYVVSQCGPDQALRAEVEELLHHHERIAPLLESASVARTTTIGMERLGTRIGPYKLLQQIGEGGFGVVFMAEQIEPVHRRVALKVIKPGMDTRQVIARFEAERQALAVMDHLNIARVLDAGATELGRPYFVMELVRGIPITQYCDENNLPVPERLQLFATVCQAIQHAHTKGIIHRDIKPTNVLVTRQDGQPVVKVIDFGVAKAMGKQLTDKTLFTDFTQMIGTPLYMSPEQAELSGLDIDTRSDIYSLGVLLYELLTGSTPVSKEQLKRAAFDEIRRIIREDEPQRPSTRISTAEAAPSIAAHRHTEPAKLARLVRGELDWIVMKALEKDRGRRYETASGFAADVLNYLADEPVLACPPSVGYRLRKFARRNKAALAIGVVASFVVLLAVVNLTVATAAIVIVALVLGIVISTSQALRAIKAERLAQSGLQAETKARTEAEQARQELEEKISQIALHSKYKSEFLANMSHELRPPLNNLLILSDQLAKNPDGNLTPPQAEFAETIRIAGSDLLNFINDIRDLSKIESGSFEVDVREMPLNDLRHFVEQEFPRVAAAKNVEFSVKFGESLPESMQTDPKRLEQIIRNLLISAAKSTQHGGVRLNVQPVTSGWNTAHENLNWAACVLAFEVADTGIDISSERQQAVFEDFPQVDAAAGRHNGGTGLGLAISHELSRLLGGEIRLASDPERGNTFTLYMPQTYRPSGASHKL